MAKRLLIFDPYDQGHHAGYILNILREVAKREEPRLVDLVLGNKFSEKHPDVVEFVVRELPDRVNWVPISETKTQSIVSAKSPWVAGLREWKALASAVKECRPDHSICMYLDFLVFPLAMGRKLPCSLSGVIFRQNRHYPEMFASRLETKERVMAEAKHQCFSRALANPNLISVFSLDPYLKGTHSESKSERISWCPDPVYFPPTSDYEATQPFSYRQTILLFGVISERKGFGKFLHAAAELPEALLRRLDFWIVGPTREEAAEVSIAEASEKLAEHGASVRRENRFVQDSEVQSYFRQSALIAAPYDRHMGMSAVIVRAAAEQKPILASSFGLLGKVVESNELGSTFDLNDSEAIRMATTRASKGEANFSQESAKRFANQNSAENFANVILDNISLPNRSDTSLIKDRESSHEETAARPAIASQS